MQAMDDLFGGEAYAVKSTEGVFWLNGSQLAVLLAGVFFQNQSLLNQTIFSILCEQWMAKSPSKNTETVRNLSKVVAKIRLKIHRSL